MIRRTFHAAMLAVLGCAVSVTASATPITAGTYTLTNTTVSAGANAYSLSGTVTLGATGLITAANITLNDSAIGNPVFTVVSSEGSGGYNPVADFAYIRTAANTGQLYLSYLQAFDSSGNIDLCIQSAGNCNSYQSSYSQLYFNSAFGYNPVDLNSGTLDPGTSGSSVTPEPASLLLMATGMLGAAAPMRRRFFRG